MRKAFFFGVSILLLTGAEGGSCGGTTEQTCPYPMDFDGDGAISIECGGNDCDDRDPNRFPGNVEVCDPEHKDEDCDPTTFGDRDRDMDGFVDAACCNGARCGTDCDDLDPTVHPNAPDVCDGKDNDCDGWVDGPSLVPLFHDVDRDGHGAGPAMLVCAGTEGYSTLSNDCDDADPGIYPGMIRCGQKLSEYSLCQSDGTWSVGYCPGQGECVPQPGGFGICLP